MLTFRVGTVHALERDMQHGVMLVTERQRLIHGTFNYDVSWTITRRYQARVVSNNERRFNIFYSAEAVRRVIADWTGPVRFRIKRERV